MFDMVTPNNLALFTKPNSSLFITIGAKCDSFFANEILSSLHLSLFSLTLLSKDHFAIYYLEFVGRCLPCPLLPLQIQSYRQHI